MSISSDIRNKRKAYINMVLFLISILIVAGITMAGEPGIAQIEVAGDILLVSLCFILLYLFLIHFRVEILDVSRKILFILATILTFVIITKFVVIRHGPGILFLIPYALIPIVIRSFYDSRLALFILLVTLMLCGLMVTEPFEFVFMNLVAGIVAILSLTDINRKYKLVFTSFTVTITYIVIYMAFVFRQYATFSTADLYQLKWFIGNGILLFSGYPVISVFENKFYFLSDATMHQLSDSNAPLLRRLAEEAPGSYQHSLQVANLAEAASRAIGANVLLSRTGSLYHDIGKITSADHFIENQKSDSNPHLSLEPEDSARIIISHVEEGVQLAHQYKIPVQVIDFIRSHHGTTKAYYFYKKYLEKEENSEFKGTDFQYKGPKPFSREMAIVMMADALEASSRTLEKYTEETISELVERAILIQEQEEQFSDAPLTFREISEIKEVFKKRLSEIYHNRIAYD